MTYNRRRTDRVASHTPEQHAQQQQQMTDARVLLEWYDRAEGLRERLAARLLQRLTPDGKGDHD